MALNRPPRGTSPYARAPIRPEYLQDLIASFNGSSSPEFHRFFVATQKLVKIGRGASRSASMDAYPGGVGYLVKGSDTQVVGGDTTTAGGDVLVELPASSWTFQVTINGPSGIGTNPGIWRAGSTEAGTCFVIDNGGTRRPWVRVNGTNVLQAASGPQWPSTGTVNLLVRFVNSTSVDVWWNGAQQHSATHSTAMIAYSGTAGIYVFGRQNGSEYLDGTYSNIRFWGRALTDAQMRRLALNPLDFYAPLPRQIFIPDIVASGTSATIDAVDGADVHALATTVTTGAVLAPTDGADVTAINAAIWTTAQLAATDGADVAAIVADASSVTNAGIAATDGADTVAIAATVTTGAAIAGVDGPDTAAINAAIWSTAQIAATDGADTQAINALVALLGQVDATDGADTTAIVADATGVLSAGIDAADGPDTVAINATVTTGASIAAVDGEDAVQINCTATTIGGWSGSGGEWNQPVGDNPFLRVIPRVVARAIERAVKEPDAIQRVKLEDELDRAGIGWDEQFAQVLQDMQARDLATVKQWRAEMERAARLQAEYEIQRLTQIARDDEDAAIALLMM